MSQSVNPFEEWFSAMGRPAPEGLLVDETYVVRPGDVLILRYAPGRLPLSEHEVDYIKRHVKERLPGVADVAVIMADEIAVYRPGE